MDYRKRIFVLLITALICVITRNSVLASFGYGEVYRLDEESGHWVSDDGAQWSSVGSEQSTESFFSNSDAASPLIVTLTVPGNEFGTEDLSSIQALGLYTSSQDKYEYISDCGLFSVTVNALPFADPGLENIFWDSNQKWFYLVHPTAYTQWKLVYRVTNNLDSPMRVFSVKDSFQKQLTIEAGQVLYSETKLKRNGQVLANRNGPHDFAGVVQIERGKEGSSFTWGDFWLAPYEVAEIELIVVTHVGPGPKQQHFECGVHELNSGGLLQYHLEKMQLQSISDGPILVKVYSLKGSTVSIELSTASIHWYLRQPGDYFVKALDGKVAVEGEGDVHVAVAFTEFADLVSDAEGNFQTIPVYYALQEPEKSNWLQPNELNSTEIVFEASASNDAVWSMWQRVVMGTQSAGEYSNKGVITFTLVNSRPSIED